MSDSDPSRLVESNTRVKYDLNADPRLRPSSTSPAAQATFLRRLGRIRSSQPAVSRPGRISRASSIASNIAIPVVLVYSIFFVDWGPHEHVFSGPQRWLKRRKDAFWSVPSEEHRPTSESS
ncbi:hypothetical protein JB92DRAFT_3149021 [Gautieria morchelliformis]|nr:hypothetical protein JB92DRAFT_3149021 [Gautieria morchelliformis]